MNSKLKVLVGTLMLSGIAMAQPSKDQVISRIKSKNPNIIKVVCSSPEKRLEAGTYKWYFGTRSHIKTEHPGITRVYSGTERYVGTTYEKSLLGSDYYIGIPDPDMTELQACLVSKGQDYFSTDYSSIVGTELPAIEPVHGAEIFWNGLNYVTVQYQSEYQIKSRDGLTLTTMKLVKNVNFSRSVDGITWDPKAKYLPEGKWINDPSRMLSTNTVSREIISTQTISAEESKNYPLYVNWMKANEANEAFDRLPKVEIPDFKTDMQAIHFVHTNMMHGDSVRMRAILYEMAPRGYFLDNSIVLTREGENFFSEVLTDMQNYKFKFCDHPKVKHYQSNMLDFYTRNGKSYGQIRVYKSQKGPWRVSEIPAGRSRSDHLTEYKEAGETHCGEAWDISDPIPIIKYSIGDRVEGEYRGTWYSGTINKVDNMMANRYFVKFDKIYGQWLTHEHLRPMLGGKNEVKDKGKDDGKGKVKDKIKGVRIKLP